MSPLILLLVHILFLSINGKEVNEDQSYWWKNAEQSLQDALSYQFNTNVAKNVILFVGDGMGISTETAARMLKGQQNGHSGEEGFLHFERFPHSALIKTYCTDGQVAESACTATAIFSGVKTRLNVVGLDSSVPFSECTAVNEKNKLPNLAHWALKEGKSVGLVTTTRITHATPSSFYAHTPNREWESDSLVPVNCQGITKDIARQLVEDFPGNQFKVILGGGWKHFRMNSFEQDGQRGNRSNDDLINKWIATNKAANRKYKFVTNSDELKEVNVWKTDSLLGLFSDNHLSYDTDRKTKQPTLTEMTKTAVEILQNNRNGYLLLVEGGLIDLAHHNGLAMKALIETIEFDKAVHSAVQIVNQQDTLIVVTADHSHTLSIGGFPARGAPIGAITRVLSTSQFIPLDNMPYTSLLYGNGPGFKIIDGKRENLTSVRTESFDYKHQAAVPLKQESHGGEDVALFAQGPMAHLFHSVHEQHYIAHVIAYAACIDERKSHCLRILRSKPKNISPTICNCVTIIFILIILSIYIQVIIY